MLILSLLVLLFLATTVAFGFAVVQGGIFWAIPAITGQGLVLLLAFWWFKRHPELGDRRGFDIATVVGMIVVVTLVAKGLLDFHPWVNPTWVLILLGAPVGALVMSFPLQNIVSFLLFVRYTILPPQAVVDSMLSEWTARNGPSTQREATSVTAESCTEAPWIRRDLELGSLMLGKLRQYLLASGLMASLFVLAGELSATDHGAVLAVALAHSAVPLACSLGLAQLICLPLQTKLESYARYLNGGSQSTSSP